MRQFQALKTSFKNGFLTGMPSARRRRNPRARTPTLRSAGLWPASDGGVSPPFQSLKHALRLLLLLLWPAYGLSGAQAPACFVSRSGDQSIVLHWDRTSDSPV